MNRKGRRSQGKQNKALPTNVLANMPTQVVNRVVNERIQHAMDEARLETSNTTLNLTASVFLIVLKEFYDFTPEQLKDVLEKVMEQLSLCGEELVSIDEMMDLVKSYGIDIIIKDDELSAIGKKMQDKIKVFAELDRGVTEIDDLVKATGVNSKDISAFRWQYNSQKYGVIDMSKMEQAFELFDRGIMDAKVVAGRLKTTVEVIYQYKSKWKQANMTPDDLADALFGVENDAHEVKDAPVVKDIAGKVEFKAHANKEQIDHFPDIREMVEETKEEVKVVGEKQVAKKGLKITRKTEIEGEFGNYAISNKVVEMKLETAHMGLEKEELIELIEELQAVAQEM